MTCISTPGQDVDVLVTQAGVAVNPKNTELRERLRAAGLPVVDIHELKERAERITGVPAPLPVSDRVVAKVISRDGELLDTIRQTDNRSRNMREIQAELLTSTVAQMCIPRQL